MGSHRVGHDWSDLAAVTATHVSYICIIMLPDTEKGKMLPIQPLPDFSPFDIQIYFTLKWNQQALQEKKSDYGKVSE